MKNFIKIVQYSSTNANKISLMVRGFAGVGASIVVGLAIILGVNATGLDTDVKQLLNNTADIITTIGTLISLAMTAYGTARKIYTIFKGTNAVVNQIEKQG